jgi:hypothetical protein
MNIALISEIVLMLSEILHCRIKPRRKSKELSRKNFILDMKFCTAMLHKKQTTREEIEVVQRRH